MQKAVKSRNNGLVLFNPYQVLLPWVRVDMGAMAMKGFSTFSKAPPLLETYHQIV